MTMNRENLQKRQAVTLKPRSMQFVIDELPLLLLCAAGFVYGGMEEMPLARLATILALLLSLVLAYRFIYLKRICYRVGSEQLTESHGVFQRSVDYIELYRIVDYHEHQSLLQQLFKLKTVTVLSMDRTTPKLDIIGLPEREDIVETIRERVEYNKQRKGVYEITNR
ncbi:MAG: PH domain-containing protein [Porphyromonadaceae bacterium]|nr:PH domain-containing protein [Porphyromonadaceae bacterium]